MTPMKRRSFLKSSLALSAFSFLPSNLDAFKELKPSLAEPVTPLRPARLVKGDTIKEVGEYNAKIKLHKEVEFDLTFVVVSE